MKKQHLEALITSIITTYLVTSFIEFDMNPDNWWWFIRFVSIITVGLSFSLIMIVNEENANKK